MSNLLVLAALAAVLTVVYRLTKPTISSIETIIREGMRKGQASSWDVCGSVSRCDVSKQSMKRRFPGRVRFFFWCLSVYAIMMKTGGSR